MLHKSICVQFQFELLHCWPDAPDEVKYLRELHRHVMHVAAVIEVFHEDRELEFIMTKHYLEQYVEATKEYWPESISCEEIAERLISIIHAKPVMTFADRDITVSVFEDGENGAVVKYTKN